ncbi:hypothetical protein EDD22DRAFT_793274, partial [Suillus occidentalis]
PDFTLPEHKAVRQQLINNGLTNEQAAWSLAALWTLSNNADIECWNLRQHHLCETRLREEEEEEEWQQHHKEEEDAAWLEERKKNKNKYVPVMHRKVPSDPTILPAQYALRKLKHYFTNGGLEDAKISTLISDVYGPASGHGPGQAEPGQSHGLMTALAWPEILKSRSRQPEPQL